MRSSYTGLFLPKNPQKYKGDVSNVVFRSLLERSFMTKLDENNNVVHWGSEEIVIPYVSPIDGRVHRYFPDFHVRMTNNDGTTTDYLVEIKPKAQCQPPNLPKSGKITKSYKMARIAWAVNDAKWKAARQFCNQHGLKFEIMTEEDAGIKRVYNKLLAGNNTKLKLPKNKVPWKSTWGAKKS